VLLATLAAMGTCVGVNTQVGAITGCTLVVSSNTFGVAQLYALGGCADQSV